MKETPYLKKKADLLQQLKTIPAFKSFEDTNLLTMLSLSKLRQYEPGETILEEGAFDCWMYFLLSGEVQVLKGSREVNTLRRYGDMFGEMAAIDGQARSATIIAKSPAMCLALDGSVMDRIDEDQKIAYYAILYKFIAEVLAERLRRATEEISRLKTELGDYQDLLQDGELDLE